MIIYFRRDIWLIIRSWAGPWSASAPGRPRGPDGLAGDHRLDPDRGAGLLFQDAIDTALRNLWITAAMLGGFGVVIGVVDHFARNVRPLESLTWRHGMLFGLAQSLALIPGVSRSGATITAGLAHGLPARRGCASTAFLLAIPAVVGSGLFKLTDIANDPVEPAWGPIALATVVAFVIGYAVIAWLLRYISTHTFLPFVIYRIVLAALVVVLLLTGVLEPLPTSSVTAVV